MALIEAARFHTLSEAEVAASLLRSAGIPASIADAHYGSVFWLEQKALGGFRLSVPEEDLPDTLELLRHPPDPLPVDEDDEPIDQPMPGGKRVLAAGLGFLSPAFGWLATRGKVGASVAEAGAGTLLSIGLLAAGAAALGAIAFALLVVGEILTNPP